MGYHRRVAVHLGALAALLAAGCSQSGRGDAGSSGSMSSGNGSGNLCSSGSSGSGGLGPGDAGLATNAGSISWGYVGQDCTNDMGFPGPGLGFCSSWGFCAGGSSDEECLDAICPACSEADGVVLWGADAAYPVFFSGLCPSTSCELEQLRCLREEASKVLSPGCATVIASLVEAELDGGSGCGSSVDGGWKPPDFCNVVGGCVGGSNSCAEAICPSCGVADLVALDGTGAGFAGGLCPLPTSCPAMECLVDAGRAVLSTTCAAAVTTLVERFLDGGLDGG